MNVIGFASNTSSSKSRVLAVIASHFDIRNVTRWRRATSSATLNPTLCRVSKYSGSGFPKPTISFKSQSPIPESAIAAAARLLLLLLARGSRRRRSSSLLSFLFLLAFLDDLGFGRRSRGSRGGRFRRRRGFLHLRNDDVHEHHVRLAEGLPLPIHRDVAYANALPDQELRHVDVDALRDVGRQAFELDLTVHEIEHAALLFHALRLAARNDRNGDLDQLVHR